jgi:hypothetical protein
MVMKQDLFVRNSSCEQKQKETGHDQLTEATFSGLEGSEGA